MKPIHSSIINAAAGQKIFLVKEFDLPYFSTEFHFHEECQLTLIIESEGKRIIGDNVDVFSKGEMTFLGSNLPHVWHNSQEYLNVQGKGKAQSIALYLKPKELLEIIGQMTHSKKLSELLDKSRLGMKIMGETKTRLEGMLKNAIHLTDMAAAINILEMVQLLSNTDEYELLASPGFINRIQFKDNPRMSLVYKHVFDNYSEEISLHTVANKAGMTPESFCRYFKSVNKKTFTYFVNEVRISHACKLLAEGETNISSIAYHCGYNSISNFNRFFKQIKQITPKEYKQQLNHE
jgi:AraC-like DNA-binding protein